MQQKVHDLIAIGIGPFNLGLAALCDSLPQLSCLFLEKNEQFNWHPGLLIEGTKLQVPFYADLVTLADPKNRFNYLCFLQATKKMFRFGIREEFFISRQQYNQYCQWVAAQLPNLAFNQCCKKISYDAQQKIYTVITADNSYQCKNVVMGIGTIPAMPSFAQSAGERFIIHSADYLHHKKTLLQQESITLVGSGQSAGEIMVDLLQQYAGDLQWFTRASHLFPMDYSKFALEKATPDYIHYFYSLSEKTKVAVLEKQNSLYKGINLHLLAAIYDLLDDRFPDKKLIYLSCELKGISGNIILDFYQHEQQAYFSHATDAVILATGYTPAPPQFLDPALISAINENYSMGNDNNLFVQNAELKSHGFNASDLSLGPYRNAVILNTILGYEHYSIERNITFQQFGSPTIKELSKEV